MPVTLFVQGMLSVGFFSIVPGGDQCVRGHVAVTMLPQPETGFSASGFVRCCTQVFISVPGSHLSFTSVLCV